MPTFTFTSPQGKTYDVEGPEGSTKEEAFKILQGKLGSTSGETKSPMQQLEDIQPSAPIKPEIPVPQTFKQRVEQEFQRTFPKLPGQKGFVEGSEKIPYELGGKVSEYATKSGLKPEVSGGLGYAANVGAQALPMVFGGEAAKVAAPILRSSAESWMTKALKPTVKEVKRGDAATAIQTMLDEGISLTKVGIDKIKRKISSLDEQIREKIAASPASVNVQEAARPLLEKLEKFKMQVNPDADVNAIKSSLNEFVNHPLVSGKTEIPIQLAQSMKQGTYAQLDKKYGEIGSAATEAQKSLARGLREGIEKGAPEAVEFTKAESNLIRTLKMAERRQIMDANKNVVGLGALAHNPALFAVYMADKSSAFKSIIARILNAGKEQIPASIARTGIAGAEMLSGVGKPPSIRNQGIPQ